MAAKDPWIQSPKGGWMHLSDYCAVYGPKGNGVQLAASAVTLDDEMTAAELGERVLNEMLSVFIDGWDALMDAIYEEDMRRDALQRSG